MYYEKETKPRYENHQESLTMAPNTNFNYRIDLKEQPFVPGNYTVKSKQTMAIKTIRGKTLSHPRKKLKIQCYRRQPPT